MQSRLYLKNKEDKNMMKDIEVLMMDGCTKTEAERFLKNGTIVLDKEDFSSGFENYMTDWSVETEEEKQKYRAMIDDKKPLQDWGIVEHDGATYYIMYRL